MNKNQRVIEFIRSAVIREIVMIDPEELAYPG